MMPAMVLLMLIILMFLTPTNGAKNHCFFMMVGVGGAAGVAYDGRDFKVINFGFPLETITDENIRKRNDYFVSVNFLLGRKVKPVRN